MLCKEFEPGPGQIAQLVGVLSRCAKVGCLIPGGHILELTNECLDSWSNGLKSSLSFPLPLHPSSFLYKIYK